jgi:hypothetical protein
MTRPARWVVQCSAALLLAGCASVEPPSVTLSSLRMQQSTLSEQRFLTMLRIQNPNDFDLAVEGLSFDLVVNDQPFAKGVGKSNTVIPAFGRAWSGGSGHDAVGVRPAVQTLARAGGRALLPPPGKLKVRDRAFSVPFEMRGDDLLQFQARSNRRDE